MRLLTLAAALLHFAYANPTAADRSSQITSGLGQRVTVLAMRSMTTQPYATLPLPLLLADSAAACAIGRHVGVSRIVRMTVAAVRSGAICIGQRADVDAAANIFGLRDWFQVGRIHTGAVSAQMIKLKTWIDWTNEMLVREAVRLKELVTDREDPVAIGAVRLPIPAGVGV